MDLSRAQSRKVMIGTPVNRTPAMEYTIAYAETCVMLERLGIARQTRMTHGNANVPVARNLIAAAFLASDCTDLIFIDDDMGWEPEAILRLLASPHEVIAGAYRQRRDDPSWCVSLLPGFEQDEGTLAIEVKATATGFMKIDRAVLERMAAAHPEWKRDYTWVNATERPHYYQFFKFDDATEMYEDFMFCHRWRDLGGSVWIDPEIELAHVGLKAWRGCIVDHLVDEALANEMRACAL